MWFNHKHENNDLGLLLQSSSQGENSRIKKIVILGCIVNAILMTLKLSVGYYGHSDALMADGYHSLNDFAADLIMLLFIGVSFRKADKSFSYGYGKFETFSTFIISLFLLFVACHITIEAIEAIKDWNEGVILPQPDLWTLVIVIISMCAKEFLFRYYRHGSYLTSTPALLTNAWHHRSDAMASVATLIGVGFSRFLGEKWRILDPCASLVLVVFIIVASLRMLYPAFLELMDHSVSPQVTKEAEKIVSSTKGVNKIYEFKSRKNGHFFIFDFTIGVNPNLTIEKASVIVGRIEENLYNKFGCKVLISVKTTPC